MGYRSFFSKKEINKHIENSKSYFAPELAIDSLLFFQTAYQQTWLIGSNFRLYCILDDIRKEEPRNAWSLPIEGLFSNDTFVLDLKVRERKNPSSKSGIIDFGANHKNWIYSKKLLGDYLEARSTIIAFLKEIYLKDDERLYVVPQRNTQDYKDFIKKAHHTSPIVRAYRESMNDTQFYLTKERKNFEIALVNNLYKALLSSDNRSTYGILLRHLIEVLEKISDQETKAQLKAKLVKTEFEGG